VTEWAPDAIFYHIYPLGLCNVPRQNPLTGPPQNHLHALIPWIDQARALGANALLLGPVMESVAHGYDGVDYFSVDRRLGDGAGLARIADEIHDRGLKLVLDGVFHHVGREFWAFRDVREKGKASHYCNWFHLDFAETSPFGDPFSYRSWNGCYDLVKLNVDNPEVRDHLFRAASSWIREYDIDGLRLDAADHLNKAFMHDLATLCREAKEDFWLMGEVVKGPYTAFLDEARLDSVTNYECYKALYSSHNDGNYHELAYCLRRHFAHGGLYQTAGLYTFADNHDVPRVASLLANQSHLYPLYCLLFTIPGIPAIYYGSEFGTKGVKAPDNDWPLRPCLDLGQIQENRRSADLRNAIARLAHLRHDLAALRRGDYEQVGLSHRCIIFSRRTTDQYIVVGVNADYKVVSQELTLPDVEAGVLVDILNPGQRFQVKGGKASMDLWPCWARIMELRDV
jgi:cyclomaltodextrinase / maltogenic alpha-amylase / neopullulanase